MSQKQINHIIDYSKSTITTNTYMNINNNVNNINNINDINNNHINSNDINNNYNKIYNIAIDVVNSKNCYYLNNISLDK